MDDHMHINNLMSMENTVFLYMIVHSDLEVVFLEYTTS